MSHCVSGWSEVVVTCVVVAIELRGKIKVAKMAKGNSFLKFIAFSLLDHKEIILS
jgi:hypothetical protein